MEGIRIRFLDKEQKEQIGLNFILENLEVFTPFGLEEKRKIKPFKKSEYNKLVLELDCIEKILQSMGIENSVYMELRRIFSRFKDIRNSLGRCITLCVLDDVELYEIKNSAMLISKLMESYEKLNLVIEGVQFHPLEELIILLDPEGEKMPTFHIYDKYSENLKTLREKKRQIENRISIENDEFQIVKLKEKRLELVIEEEQEELNIRIRLTEKLSKHVNIIENNIQSIGRLDFLIAKATIALKNKGVRPEIKESVEISIEDAFNPEIVEILSKKGKCFTAVSIGLNRGTTVITGANMGGKSVTLKTIVLNLLLGQMGFFVFARSAKFPVLDFIHFISDDMQSISKGLSTFGAEIIKLNEVLRYAKGEHGFIALDEFARGTNPKEGFYIVKSLCEYLNKLHSFSLVSTHYDGVVQSDMEHYQVIGLKNVNFDGLKHKIDLNRMHSIEIIQEHMEYKLERVPKENAVPKDALNISVLLGLEEDLVSIVKGYYEKDKNDE